MKNKTAIYGLPGISVDFIEGKIKNENDDREEKITPLEADILKRFIENPGIVLSRRQIMSCAGRGMLSDYSDIRSIANDHISKLRKAFTNVGLDYDRTCELIKTVRNKGYCWNPPEEEAREYLPLDGLRECVKKCCEYDYDIKCVDVCIQTGQLMSELLLENWNADECFLGLLNKDVKFRVIINVPDAVSRSYIKCSKDYLRNWYNIYLHHKSQFDVRVSEETFHERLFIAHCSETDYRGIVNVRVYWYSVGLSDSVTKTIPISDEKNFYVAEFQKHHKFSMTIEDFYKSYVIGSSTWERRLITAYEEKEKGDVHTFICTLEALSEEGYARAMYNLACCYVAGRYVEVDFRRAFDLFSAAAKKGDNDALFRLAQFYWFGYGECPQDYFQAIEYFYNLADTDADSCFYLYLAYRDGLGIERNPRKAEQYRMLAENQGVKRQRMFDF